MLKRQTMPTSNSSSSIFTILKGAERRRKMAYLAVKTADGKGGIRPHLTAVK